MKCQRASIEWKEKLIFSQLVGRGGVQSKRCGFDDGACSTGNQQNEESRIEKEVIIKDCSQEDVTPNKQHDAFPIYDDSIFFLLLFVTS